MNILEASYVKEVIEDLTNIPDISIPSREAYIVQARFIYMKVCSVFKSRLYNNSLEYIGKGIKRTRASVIHGIKKFDYDNLNNSFIYKKALNIIKEHLDLYVDEKEINETILRIYYRTKHIELQEKYRSVISKLQNKLSTYENNPFIDKLAALDDESLKEAEIKFDAFLKVKKAMKR